MAEQNINEIDSGFFTKVGTLDSYKNFYKYNPDDNGVATLKPKNDYNLPDSHIHVSNNMFPTEHITCREFKPNQFAILGLFDTLKEFYELGADTMSAIMSSSTDKTKTQSETETEKEAELIKAKNKVIRIGKLSLLAMLNTLQPGPTIIDEEIEDIVVENDITKEKVVVGSITNKIQGPPLWTDTQFIIGPMRNKVNKNYRTLDMFYDLPQYFYKNLSAGVYGRTFTLPIVNNSSYISSSSASQYEVDDGNLGTIRDLLSKVVGQMSQIGLPSGITWKGASSNFPAINYTIDLYNKTSLDTQNNIEFVNNIVAGNMWAQRGLFKSPSALYDVAIKSRHLRMFYCTGAFNCTYEGKIRSHTISSKSTVAVIAPSNIKEMLELNNSAISKISTLQDAKKELMNALNVQISMIERSTQATAINEELVKKYKETYDNLQIRLADLDKVTLDRDGANIMTVEYIKAYLIQVDELLKHIKDTVVDYTKEMQKYRKLVINVNPPKYEEPAEPSGFKNYMAHDGTVKTVYSYNGKKIAEGSKQETTINTEKNPILEKISNLSTKIDKLISIIQEQLNKLASAGLDDLTINLAKADAATTDVVADLNNGIMIDAKDRKYRKSHADAASTLINATNEQISNAVIVECINEAYSIAKDYENVKKSDQYTTKSNDELKQMTEDYDNSVNSSKTTIDRLAANEKFKESQKTPYQNAINEINKTKAETEKYYDKLIADGNKEISKLKAELENSMTSLTPKLTHIPDVFKLSIDFSSLLPNNLNSYLYSIEYSNETQTDKAKGEVKTNDGVVVRPPKLAQFVNTFRSNLKELQQEQYLDLDQSIENSKNRLFKADTSEFNKGNAAIQNIIDNDKKLAETQLTVDESGKTTMHPSAMIKAQSELVYETSKGIKNTPETAGAIEAMALNSKTE